MSLTNLGYRMAIIEAQPGVRFNVIPEQEDFAIRLMKSRLVP